MKRDHNFKSVKRGGGQNRQNREASPMSPYVDIRANKALKNEEINQFQNSNRSTDFILILAWSNLNSKNSLSNAQRIASITSPHRGQINKVSNLNQRWNSNLQSRGLRSNLRSKKMIKTQVNLKI